MVKLNMTRRGFTKLAAAVGSSSVLSTAVLPMRAFAEQGASVTSEVRKTRSHCRACGKMECPIWVWVADGRVVDITGDESAVSSRGNLCAKGKSAMQALYHPARVKYPMKRTNPKGEDPGWVRISWDEALETSAQALQATIDKYGGPAVKTLHGTSRITSYSVMTLGNYFGSPNSGCTAGQVCKGPRDAAGALTCFPAHWASLNDGVDLFFQWGTAQELSNYDNAARVTVDAQVNARKSIVVGPRLQNLGKECDVWVPLRPGTDDVFGLALMNIIINEMGSFDELFMKRWSTAPFLFVEDLEPTGFPWSTELEGGKFPLTISTRLLKESDMVEGGSVKRFIVWDLKSGQPIYFDTESVLWEGETEYNEPVDIKKHGRGYLVEDAGFGVDIDPALKGEYEVTLVDGRTAKAIPVFQLFADRVAEWTPEKAGAHCWVDPDTIREAASLYGEKVMQGGVQYQLALEHAGNAITSTRIALILSALMGNLDTPGGNRGGEASQYLYHTFISYAAPLGAPPADPKTQAMVAGGERYPLLPFYRTVGGAAMHYDQTTATDMMLEGKPYPIRSMVSATGSHFHSANATKNWEATKAMDFYLAFELWHSPTVELADILVPAAHFLEVSNLRISQGAESGLGAQVAVVPPLGEARWDSAQIVQLVKEMGIPWWPTSKETAPPFWPEEWLDIVWPDENQLNELSVLPLVRGFAAPGPDGKTLSVKGWEDFVAQYQEHGQWDLRDITPIGYFRRYLLGYMRSDRLPGFDTPTGKLELWSTLLESYHPGHELPIAQEPFESPYSTPDVYQDYPIILTSGRRIPVFFHSEGRQQPYCREQAVVPTFQINPETAQEYGIEQGDWCWIESRRGKVRLVADYFYGIAPGVIEADHGWWFPELPGPSHGWELSNINCLVDEYAQDPLGGATTLRAYLVKVYKATPENCPNGQVVPCAQEDGTPIIADSEDRRLKEWMPAYGGEE